MISYLGISVFYNRELDNVGIEVQQRDEHQYAYRSVNPNQHLRHSQVQPPRREPIHEAIRLVLQV